VANHDSSPFSGNHTTTHEYEREHHETAYRNDVRNPDVWPDAAGRLAEKTTTMTKPTKPKKRAKKDETQWPERVAREKRALDLEPGLYEKSAKVIAHTLKVAAEESTTKKGTPLQAAMGAVNFLMNRRGKSMAEDQRTKLERVKVELRKLFAA